VQQADFGDNLLVPLLMPVMTPLLMRPPLTARSRLVVAMARGGSVVVGGEGVVVALAIVGCCSQRKMPRLLRLWLQPRATPMTAPTIKHPTRVCLRIILAMLQLPSREGEEEEEEEEEEFVFAHFFNIIDHHVYMHAKKPRAQADAVLLSVPAWR
jgi:hypothetical protein